MHHTRAVSTFTMSETIIFCPNIMQHNTFLLSKLMKIIIGCKQLLPIYKLLLWSFKYHLGTYYLGPNRMPFPTRKHTEKADLQTVKST